MSQQTLNENNLLFALIYDAAACYHSNPSLWASVQGDKTQFLSAPFLVLRLNAFLIINSTTANNKPFNIYTVLCASERRNTCVPSDQEVENLQLSNRMKN